jgi:hypothetical protein
MTKDEHDLVWQDALLAATVRPMSDNAMLVGWSGASARRMQRRQDVVR